MCGRAVLSSPPEDIAELLGVGPMPIETGPPRYNVSPGQPVVVLRLDREGRRELATPMWGLRPFWAKDKGRPFIQARAETVESAAAFRDAFKSRRCVFVFDGFYEWKHDAKKRGDPFYLRPAAGGLLAIAGVWESYRSGAARVETCAVVTTTAHGAVAALHDRMPLILPPAEREAWIASADGARDVITRAVAIEEQVAEELVAVRVSTWVNDVKHEDARCVEPAAETG